jgi:glutamine amidotransferase
VSAAQPPIGVVDYGLGNRRSVEKALVHAGARPVVSGDPATLRAAAGLVVPGVGAFAAGIAGLRALALDELLHDRAARGIPILGVCLGMQLLFEGSEEGAGSAGLGLIEGQVRALRGGGLRIPHIGWSEVRFVRACRLTAGLPASGRPFYHVHSYAAHPTRPEDVVATCEYGEPFASIVARGSVFGVQFHPEKSSVDGLAILAAFTALAAGDGGAVAAAASAA